MNIANSLAPREIQSEASRLIVFLAYPQMGLLDLTGAQTVFWAASRYLSSSNLPGYKLQTASLNGGLIQTAEGLAVDTLPLSDFAEHLIDTLIVPGAPEIILAMNNALDVVDWLKNAATQVRRTASVCSGTFLLAEAGLLDGRRAATHWAMCGMLKERHPSIEVDNDAILDRKSVV